MQWSKKKRQRCGVIIAITKNPALHGRTKHIDLRFHYIRDLVANGTLSLQHCNTSDQVADILTKALSGEKACIFEKSAGNTPSSIKGEC